VPRTKDAIAALGALGVSGKVLVVVTRDDAIAERSFDNLQEIQTVLVDELAAHDVLRNEWIVFSDATLPGAARDDQDEADADEAEDGADA
jgi:ribosomal protein L4